MNAIAARMKDESQILSLKDYRIQLLLTLLLPSSIVSVHSYYELSFLAILSPLWMLFTGGLAATAWTNWNWILTAVHAPLFFVVGLLYLLPRRPGWSSSTISRMKYIVLLAPLGTLICLLLSFRIIDSVSGLTTEFVVPFPIATLFHMMAYRESARTQTAVRKCLEEANEGLRQIGFVEIGKAADRLGVSAETLARAERTFGVEYMIVGNGRLIATTDWISSFKNSALKKGVVNLDRFSAELGVSRESLALLLVTYLNGTFDINRTRFIVGSSRSDGTPVAAELGTGVKILRGGEFVGSRFRYKVKIQNDSDYAINDVTVMLLSYPKESLKLEGEVMKAMARIDPRGFRSPSFDFLPTTDCVRGDVVASVSFLDSKGVPHSQTTDPFTIRAVCDLLRPENVTPDEFALKLTSLGHGELESRVEDWTPEEMHMKTIEILKQSNFFEVTSDISELADHVESKISGWARGVYTGKSIGLQVTITGRPNLRGAVCHVKMSGEDNAMIMPAIDEISHKLSAWLCPRCGAGLPPEVVDTLKAGTSVACPFCGVTMDR